MDNEHILNSLLRISNIDVYVTGSNSKFLSSDIVTEFRGRGDEIKIYPLSFAEFYDAYDGDYDDAWNEYMIYGGLPQVAQFSMESIADKKGAIARSALAPGNSTLLYLSDKSVFTF